MSDTCEFEPTGAAHAKTGRRQWKCVLCSKVCWGDSPANSRCKSGIATPPRFSAECHLGLRGEVIGTANCGCGGMVEIAVCGLAKELGGTGHCTPRGLTGREGWRSIDGVTERPRACSTCRIMLEKSRGTQ